MKTIASCTNLGQAQHFKTVLEAVRIPTFIPDEMMASIAPHHFFTSSSGVRVQVADENAEEAEKIIEALRSEK